MTVHPKPSTSALLRSFIQPGGSKQHSSSYNIPFVIFDAQIRHDKQKLLRCRFGPNTYDLLSCDRDFLSACWWNLMFFTILALNSSNPLESTSGAVVISTCGLWCSVKCYAPHSECWYSHCAPDGIQTLTDPDRTFKIWLTGPLNDGRFHVLSSNNTASYHHSSEI